MNFHEERLTGIGGSDAAAVLGLSPWVTPLQLYLEKRGEATGPTEESPAMRWGSRLEALVRQEYCDQTGETVVVPADMLRHPQYPWMLAHLDGMTASGKVYEGKTARFATGWGEPGTDEIPDPYLVQVQHYLTVTGAAAADVAVLIHGSDFRVYTVQADPELQQLLVDEERAFWQRVQDGTPPDPITVEDAALRWRQSKGRVVQASDEVASACRRLADLKRQLKTTEEAADQLQTVILSAMGDADTLCQGDQVLATWKTGKAPQRVDLDLLKTNHADVYAACLKTGPAPRRFLLKERKPL